MKSNATGIIRILKAFTYSFDGFVSAFKSEAAFRQDILFCIIAGILAFIMEATAMQRVVMICALLFILFMELVNTAIEAVVDRISDDYHILSKKAKDIGSLLVLLAFIQTFIVFGTVIYCNYF